MRQVSPKIEDRAAAFYSTHFTSLNQGVTYTLESFPTIYRRTLAELHGQFTEAELSLLLDLVNGLMLTAQFAGQHLYHEVADGISLDLLDKKWRVDGASLLSKLRAITVGQTAILEIWARAFWSQNPLPELADWCRPLLS